MLSYFESMKYAFVGQERRRDAFVGQERRRGTPQVFGAI
jgi:hypothetical protein